MPNASPTISTLSSDSPSCPTSSTTPSRSSPGSATNAAFWGKNREITDLFRENHLPREDRERLWARKAALCARVHELQTCEREARENDSRQNTEQIIDLVGEAESWAKGAETFDHLREVRTRLADAALLIKDGYLSHEDRRASWERWWEVKRLLGFREAELAEEHRRQHEARAHGRRERLEEAIRRRRSYVEENDRMIPRLRDEIDELEAEIASAWTEAWADRARERVQAKYGKVTALERRNTELEVEISDIARDLESRGTVPKRPTPTDPSPSLLPRSATACCSTHRRRRA